MRVAKVIIGDIDSLTGGYLYEKKLVHYLREAGLQADVVSIPQLPYVFSVLYSLCLPFRLRAYHLIIEDEMAHPALWLFNLWAKRASKARVIALVHMFGWLAARRRWRAALLRLTERTMLGACDLVIANSRSTSEAAQRMGLPAEAIVVVYPGFDVDLATPRHARRGHGTRLLFVGNLDPRKGLHTLVEAIHLLKDPEIVLDVLGDESSHPRYARRVRRLVANRGLEGAVRLHGRVDRQSVARFYSEADVFVLPSSYEPFGIVFAEAMSCGLPIIATSAGGTPELVVHGENGLLVPPHDVNALAEAIASLATDHELRRALGARGYEKSKQLNTWDDCFRIIHGHVERLMPPDADKARAA